MLTTAGSKDARLTPFGTETDRTSRFIVAAFACLVGVLVLIAAYCIDRNGDIDEIGFLNPPYMLANYGKLTFPAYAHNSFFDLPVITHPPLHLALVGMLWRVGLSPYYAEATPTVLLFLLCIVMIVRGAFPAAIKLALVFSIGFLATKTPPWMLCFGTRPEGHLHAAWLCGLVLLESGRLEDWRRSKLFAGAFFLAWASGVHYYAGVAAAGLVVYILWVTRSLGWEKAKPQVLAICAGGALFGMPYLLFYVLPHWHIIWSTIRANQGTAGIAGSIGRHFDLYLALAHAAFQPALLRAATSLGVPLVIFSTAILFAVRSTRGIALAALPLQLFIFFFASHKLDSYLLHETSLFAAAGCAGLVVAVEHLVRRSGVSWLLRAVIPAAAVLLSLYLTVDSLALSAAVISTKPHGHEAVLARAATRQILGTDARVGGRWGSWYSSGAEHWYNIEHDLLHPALLFDPATYFSNFDTLAEYPHMSGGGDPNTLSSWYADGTLKLRAFYFGETNPQLQFVLLSSHRAQVIAGYVSAHGRLFRFEEAPNGDYEVIAAACPVSPELAYGNWEHRWDRAYASVLLLPASSPDYPKVLATVLTPRLAEPGSWMRRSCRTVQELRGTLSPANGEALLAGLWQNDKPIRFYRNLEQMPGYTGVGIPKNSKEVLPPENTTRLDHAVDLSRIEALPNASVEPGPPVRVRTIQLRGGFSASIPVNHTDPPTAACWVELKLRVAAGRVGFAAYNRRSGIIVRTLGLAKSRDPRNLVLQVPDLRNVDDIILFNDGDEETSQVEVLDATVLVAAVHP